MIVEGMVQGAGYRAFVKAYANRNGINGLVRNLNDGRVEIFCNGSKERIEHFAKEIDVKNQPSGYLSLSVDKLLVYWEGEECFEDSWKEYRGFEIDYGPEKLSQFERENLDSLEWAKLRFSLLENGINSFRDETKQNFDLMANKYGEISAGVKATKEELKASLDKLPDEIGAAVTKHAKKLAFEANSSKR